jgi:hypothetical protein
VRLVAGLPHGVTRIWKVCSSFTSSELLGVIVLNECAPLWLDNSDVCGLGLTKATSDTEYVICVSRPLNDTHCAIYFKNYEIH